METGNRRNAVLNRTLQRFHSFLKSNSTASKRRNYVWRGYLAEEVLIELLRLKGYRAEHASPRVDKVADVDIWVYKKGRVIGISVKANSYVPKSGAISVEEVIKDPWKSPLYYSKALYYAYVGAYSQDGLVIISDVWIIPRSEILKALYLPHKVKYPTATTRKANPQGYRNKSVRIHVIPLKLMRYTHYKIPPHLSLWPSVE